MIVFCKVPCRSLQGNPNVTVMSPPNHLLKCGRGRVVALSQNGGVLSGLSCESATFNAPSPTYPPKLRWNPKRGSSKNTILTAGFYVEGLANLGSGKSLHSWTHCPAANPSRSQFTCMIWWFPKIGGTQYRPQNIIILIIGTPTMVPHFRKPPFSETPE